MLGQNASTSSLSLTASQLHACSKARLVCPTSTNIAHGISATPKEKQREPEGLYEFDAIRMS
jgi:hypothetical protein